MCFSLSRHCFEFRFLVSLSNCFFIVDVVNWLCVNLILKHFVINFTVCVGVCKDKLMVIKKFNIFINLWSILCVFVFLWFFNCFNISITIFLFDTFAVFTAIKNTFFWVFQHFFFQKKTSFFSFSISGSGLVIFQELRNTFRVFAWWR